MTLSPASVPMATFARSVAGNLQMTPAQTGTVGMVKPGGAMEVAVDGTINPLFGTTPGTVADGAALAAAAGVAASAQATAGQALETANGALSSAAPVITAPLSNPSIIAESYEIPANSNAVNFGPITIAQGATVTVPQSSTYRIF